MTRSYLYFSVEREILAHPMKRFETFAIQRTWYQPLVQAGDQARGVPLNSCILSGNVGVLTVVVPNHFGKTAWAY